MSREQRSTIRNGIKKCLSPIPRHVKAYREPQIPRSPQRQAKEETNRRRCRQSRPLLACILQVNQTEGAREHYRGRPKANQSRQCKLRISTQQKFFKESYEQEKHCPEQCKPHNSPAMYRQMSQVKNS